MKIAVAQMNPTSGDVRGNTERHVELIEKAKEKKADLIVMPEMSLPGYCIGDLLEDKSFLAANRESVERIAKATNGITAIAGFIDFDLHAKNEDGRVRKYNAAVVMQNGSIAGISHKSLLPNYRYFDDKRFFTPAELREPIKIQYNGGYSLGVSICEDMWDSFYGIKPISELADKGADIIFNINASPFVPGKRFARDKIIKAHVRATGKPFVYVNTVGAGDNGKNIIPFDGQSMVYDASGNLIALGKQFEEELFLVDLERASPIRLPPLEREKEIYEALVMGLREYAKKATGGPFARAIVPVSGGIDSALGLAITADALGAENVTAYNLPSRYNSDMTKGIARRLAENFGTQYKIVPIQEINDSIIKTFEQHAHPISNPVAKENVHARIRGLLMMLESNDRRSLLISCGNETEIALGYSTLYGDMCGGVSVIGDLSKVDVYQISRHVNERHGSEMIPEDAFKIKPSAELCENQYDPFDYYVTAPVVGEIIENRRSPSELRRLFESRKLDASRFVADPEGKSVYDKHTPESFADLAYQTYRQINRSVYKRLQGAPIIAVSDRAFGFDLRETLINGWGVI